MGVCNNFNWLAHAYRFYPAPRRTHLLPALTAARVVTVSGLISRDTMTRMLTSDPSFAHLGSLLSPASFVVDGYIGIYAAMQLVSYFVSARTARLYFVSARTIKDIIIIGLGVRAACDLHKTHEL